MDYLGIFSKLLCGASEEDEGDKVGHLNIEAIRRTSHMSMSTMIESVL